MPTLNWIKNLLPLGPPDAQKMITKAYQNRLRNESLPIYKLPPEVLVKIFFFCREISWEPVDSVDEVKQGELLNTNNPDRATVESLAKYTWRWPKVAHVSHHWRAVAIGCPTLWSEFHWFDFAHTGWMEEKLARTQAVPVSLQIPYCLHYKLAAILFVAAHRMKSLDIQFVCERGDKFAEEVKVYSEGMPMDVLESLEICGYNATDDTDDYALPADFLDVSTPNLRSLKSYCALPWDASLLQVGSLTSLDMSSTHTPTAEQVFNIFKAAPKLTYVKLSSRLPAYDAFALYSRTSHERISLPHLEYFEVETSHLESCSGLFKNIIIPRSATVIVRTDEAITSATRENPIKSIYASWVEANILPEVLQFVKALRSAWFATIDNATYKWLEFSLEASEWSQEYFEQPVFLDNNAEQLVKVIWLACEASLEEWEWKNECKRWVPPMTMTMKLV
ncbi:hypothetical protein CC2G_013822 [Coprinopsis cinerea AmutBmut pab1-1]|nr:hypothetical protein CC2G_013822 [Coprinopsis cinerea AmutBmut pab1-1]